MTVYRDNASLLLAPEPQWGQWPHVAFHPLPFQRETLAPERRHIYASSLEGGGAKLAPVLNEETATGDVELLATSRNLSLLLPHLLHGTATSATVTLAGRRTTSTGRLNIGGLIPGLKAGDMVTLRHAAGAEGWHQVIDGGGSGISALAIPGLKPSTTLVSGASLSVKRITPSDEPTSLKLLKSYRKGAEWLSFNGVMLSRLSLDLTEGELLKAGLGILGRDMTVITSSPSTLSEVDTPLGFARGLKIFTLDGGDDDTLLTQNNSIITGCRLVMERVGMAPQYALGDTRPKLILPGELAVYGVVDLLIGDYTMFRWLQDNRPITLSFALEDNHGGGVAVVLPEIRLRELDLPSAPEGEPLRARLLFDAYAEGTTPMSTTFIQPSA
ncbi:MAG: hypothetical protein J4F41_09455 [Alphaproteobacteria bacterium]|nr:hypothetical protein [Alphaproteobacteria bacterium]